MGADARATSTVPHPAGQPWPPRAGPRLRRMAPGSRARLGDESPAAAHRATTRAGQRRRPRPGRSRRVPATHRLRRLGARMRLRAFQARTGGGRGMSVRVSNRSSLRRRLASGPGRAPPRGPGSTCRRCHASPQPSAVGPRTRTATRSSRRARESEAFGGRVGARGLAHRPGALRLPTPPHADLPVRSAPAPPGAAGGRTGRGVRRVDDLHLARARQPHPPQITDKSTGARYPAPLDPVTWQSGDVDNGVRAIGSAESEVHRLAGLGPPPLRPPATARPLGVVGHPGAPHPDSDDPVRRRATTTPSHPRARRGRSHTTPIMASSPREILMRSHSPPRGRRRTRDRNDTPERARPQQAAIAEASLKTPHVRGQR